LRNKIRSNDIRKQLGTKRMVEEIQEYERKWHNHAETMPPERLPWQGHYFIDLLEDGALDVREDGQNSSFSVRTGHDSILERAQEEDYVNNKWTTRHGVDILFIHYK
jgi:hypothetical protein